MNDSMNDSWSRRDVLRTGLGVAAGLGLPAVASRAAGKQGPAKPLFEISLAQWSLHRSLFTVDPAEMGWPKLIETLRGGDYRSLVKGEIDPLDFARVARRDFDIGGIEYVNTFFFDRAEDRPYLRRLKAVADGEGVRSLLIMCDFEGDLGDPDPAKRAGAVENHRKWVHAARFLGCHSIRVNAGSDESLSAEEQQKLAADGLRRLCELADEHEIDVLVENHGGLSSDAGWLAGVMAKVDHPRAGTLPDFGNFQISADPERWYDRYRGVRELMPWAKAVSAKSHAFDADGNETGTDFRKMMKIVLDAGYRGWVGIEYEGSGLAEKDGIRATKALLERIRDELAGEVAT